MLSEAKHLTGDGIENHRDAVRCFPPVSMTLRFHGSCGELPSASTPGLYCRAPVDRARRRRNPRFSQQALTQVLNHHLRRIMTRDTRDSSAGMRSAAAEVEARERRAVVGVARDRPQIEALIGCHFAVK